MSESKLPVGNNVPLPREATGGSVHHGGGGWMVVKDLNLDPYYDCLLVDKRAERWVHKTASYSC